MDNNTNAEWLTLMRKHAPPEDVATAELVLQYEVLPAEVRFSEPVERFIQRKLLEVKPSATGDGFDYRTIIDHEIWHEVDLTVRTEANFPGDSTA